MEFSNTDYLERLTKKMKTKIIIQCIIVASLLPLISLIPRIINSNFLTLFLLNCSFFFLFFFSIFYVLGNYRCYVEIQMAQAEAQKLIKDKNGISKDVLDKCLDIILEEYYEIQNFKENFDINSLKKIEQLRSNLTLEIGEEHEYHSIISIFSNVLKRHLFRAFDTKTIFTSKQIHFHNWRFNSGLANYENKKNENKKMV